MSCDRHTNAIVDHACGADIAADAAAHLNGCGACRRMFDEQLRVVQNLDGQLALALAIGPSPRFVPEVLARVEGSAFRSRSVMWWRGAAAAAAVLTIVTFGSLRPGERREEDRLAAALSSTAPSAPVAERTPPLVTPPASPETNLRRAVPRRHVDRPRNVVDHPGRVVSEVVVPATESRGLTRYLALVRGGALDTSTLPSADGTGVVPPAELVIAPLAVEALAVTDVKAGIGPVSRREPATR